MKRANSRRLDLVLLRLLIFQLFLPSLLITLAAVGLTAYERQRSLESRQLELAHSFSHIVSHYLEHAGRVLDAVARLAETASQGEVSHYMLVTRQAYHYFDALYHLDANGTVLAHAPFDVGHLGLDMSHQPYFRLAAGQDGMAISQPFASIHTGQPIVYMAYPLSTGGLVVGELNLAALQQTIDEQCDDDSCSIFITAASGALLAHPNPEWVAQQVNLGHLEIVQRGLEGESTLIYRADGRLVIGGTTLIERTGWVVVIQTPLLAAYAPYVWPIGLAVLLSPAVWLTLVWSLRRQLRRHIVLPLNRLSQEADALAAGNYTQNGNLDGIVPAFAEIDALMDNFRHMSQAIQERQRAELEQRLLAETLQEVTLVLASQTSPKAVLDEILRQAERLVSYHTAHIMLLEGDVLRSAGWQGYEAFASQEFIAGLVQPWVDYPLDAATIATRAPCLVTDTRTEPRWIVAAETAWIRSHISMPICLRDRVLGLLRLDSDEPHHFSTHDIWRLQPLANAAAIALENARLFTATRRQAEELEALHQVSKGLAALRDLDTLLQHIVEQAIQLLGADSGGMYLLRPDEARLEWVVAVGEKLERQGLKIERGEGLAGKVWNSGQPLIVEDYGRWAGRSPQWVDNQVRSVIGVPIHWRQELLGVLCVRSDDPNLTFTADDTALLSQFTAQAAIAIQNTRLYEQVQRHAADLEKRVAERTRELERSEAQMRAQYKGIPVPTYTWQRHGDDLMLVDYNDAAMAFTAGKIATLMGSQASVLHADDPQILEELNRCLREQCTIEREMTHRLRSTGENKYLNVKYAFVPPDLVMVHTEDISRQKELDRLKSKFVSDVSHELRTPVTNIRLYLHLLERSPEKFAQHMAVLKDQSGRLANLIEDILNLSRLDLDHERADFVPIDLNRAVEQVVTAHQARAELAGLELIFDPDPSLPPVPVEPNQLDQVLTNLLGNALNYTLAGTIHLRTRLEADRGRARLDVQDSGMGIATEDLPHIFDRFYRGQRVGSLSIPGTGLGLAIVKEIVEQHGGEIQVESQVGQGSRFTVWLPLDARKP
ncbi:MAG: GAF domain-containing protein [Chloroflexota bacterium]